MSEGVFASIPAIEQVGAAFQVMAGRVREWLPQIEQEMRRLSESLDDRRGDFRREISQLEEAIASAGEDDDTSQLERDLEEAQEQLILVRRRAQRLAEASTDLRAVARRLEPLADGESIKAREFLARAISDLKAYFSATLSGAGESGFSSPSGVRTFSPNVDAGFDPTPLPLPPGFAWVPLAQIDRNARDFAGVEEFTKVSRAEMERGFALLQGEVLPGISGGADSAAFGIMDQAGGTTHEHGRQRVFDAFFGQDAIFLERGSDETSWSVTNGRHRILVAESLGWSAVPVRVPPQGGTP